MIYCSALRERHLGEENAVHHTLADSTCVNGSALTNGRTMRMPEILKATMLYDLYARESLKSRPAWAQEILYRPFCEDFYRDETLTRQYLPSYSECTPRQMKRMTHMEGFEMNIVETAKAGQRIGGPEVLLFDYKERTAGSCSENCKCVDEMIVNASMK